MEDLRNGKNNIIPHINEIKRPLKYGELINVPCFVRRKDGILYITPIIDHPHSDIENGQIEVHYHADYRFLKFTFNTFLGIPIVKNEHSKHFFCEHSRHIKGETGEIVNYILPVQNESQYNITPKKNIKNSKLKHKCIKNGKCSHRGYDLSQVKIKEGKITCPLHGLQFDENTKKLIE